LKTVEITLAQFQEFCELQQKRRWDWPATFSTNSKGEVWPFLRKGYTPPRERENVRAYSPLLAIVADIYTTQRGEGGRFFVNEVGAFWKSDPVEPIQFVKWDAGEKRLLSPMQAKREELARPFILTPDQRKQLMRELREKKKRP
jgi:hypothetical protein